MRASAGGGCHSQFVIVLVSAAVPCCPVLAHRHSCANCCMAVFAAATPSRDPVCMRVYAGCVTIMHGVQMQRCWSPPCVRGLTSPAVPRGEPRMQHGSERVVPARPTAPREVPARRHAHSGQSGDCARSRSGGARDDSGLGDSGAASIGCHSGVHVVMAQGLGIGRKRFVSGEKAAQLQNSQDADLLVYSSISSSQSPSRVVA